MKLLKRIREFFQPQVRVGIAVMVVKNRKIMFGRRTKKKVGLGTYQLPGGHLDMLESWEECAHREVLEETGVQIKNVRLVTVTNNPWPRLGKHYVTIFMAADWDMGEIKAGKGHEDAEWIWYDYIPKPLFESEEPILMFCSEEKGKLAGALGHSSGLKITPRALQ